MKAIATSVLVAMAVLFALSAWLRPAYPWLAWLQAFSEAAVIGGLADWFAVVALFRHPGGVPFPHTAIVPQNKDRIGTQLGLFVEQNFLTAGNLAARLRDIEPARHLLQWLADEGNVRALAAAVRDLVPRLVDAADDVEIHAVLRRVLLDQLEQVDLAQSGAAALSVVAAEGVHQRALDRALPVIARWLNAQREEIKRRFARRSLLTPGFVDAYIVNRFVDGMVDLIGEIASAPEHPMRRELDDYVRELIARLRDDPAVAAGAERLKATLLRGTPIDQVAAAAWNALKTRLSRAPEAGGELGAGLGGVVAKVAQGLLAQPATVARLDEKLCAAAESVLGRFQHHFAALITDVVRRWDAREISDKIEVELGPDLQYIRLNGSIVGGAAGVVLHAALVISGAA